MTRHPFTLAVLEAVRSIPRGRVATYGGIAAMAGNARAARQVVRILHTLSDQEELPWHRVINRKGEIALSLHQGFERQKDLLEREGILFSENGTVDLECYLWIPGSEQD